NLMILKSYANIDNMNLTVKIKNISVCENEIAVTMSNREMTVSSFTCGIHYDRESLKLISISGCDVSDSDQIGIKRNSDGSIWEVFAVSTIEEAEANGNVGFAFVNSSDDVYAATTFVELKFQIISSKATSIVVYEDSAGSDGVISEYTMDINLSEHEHDYNYNLYNNNEFGHWHKCLYCDYCTDVKPHVPATDNTRICKDCGYSLAENSIVYGDINNDGKINLDDVIKLLRHISKADIITDPKELAACEIVDDGRINIDDVVRLLRFVSKAIPSLK
ncbi:MAG: dockerin type I repeat-containing protein, partial [Clostridia bacterium]|nr:dockerin type I repeat-containing protein [Clostridia bacterium]